jgi:uncharacterized protein (TIGR02145 family)
LNQLNSSILELDLENNFNGNVYLVESANSGEHFILFSDQYNDGTNQSFFNLFLSGTFIISQNSVMSGDEYASFFASDACQSNQQQQVYINYDTSYTNNFGINYSFSSNAMSQIRCVKD